MDYSHTPMPDFLNACQNTLDYDHQLGLSARMWIKSGKSWPEWPEDVLRWLVARCQANMAYDQTEEE